MKFTQLIFLYLFLSFASIANAQQYLLRSPKLQALPDSLHKRSLTELSFLFGTDKQASMHNFIELYERYLTPVQDSVHRLLEIGIFNGASHKMWKCFFDSVEVYGIDIRPMQQLQRLGIHTFVANQSSRADLQAFVEASGGQFDVIVDDGGHFMDHQQISLGVLFPELRPGGLYIIEDVHTSIPKFYRGFGKDSACTNTTLELFVNYLMTEQIDSEFMNEKEANYLEEQIDYIEIYKRKNRFHSTAVLIRKKNSN